MDTAFEDNAPIVLKDTLNSLFLRQQFNGWNVYATLEGTKLVLHWKPPSYPREFNAKYCRMNEHQQQCDADRASQ